MKKNFISILLMFAIVSLICIDAKAALTIATFSDPSNDSLSPLFTVDFTEMALTGEWSDAQTGLLLNIPYSGNTFADAWFEMTEVIILNTSGDTSGGEINFYEDGTSENPLITINFESGYVDNFNLGADEFFGENVTITGSQITGTLSEEEFSFNFANPAYLQDSENWNDGFTATAAFTSSAIPEPATIALLGLGTLGLVRSKK
jgi:hypothetical protein